MKKYKLEITLSSFGKVEKFYRTFTKGNRILIIENIEFENTPEQHVSGFAIEKFRTKKSPKEIMDKFFKDNPELKREYFDLKIENETVLNEESYEKLRNER